MRIEAVDEICLSNKLAEPASRFFYIFVAKAQFVKNLHIVNTTIPEQNSYYVVFIFAPIASKS